ncbi:MAG TPA: serine hydrolase domain-containing protein [Solirubrobacterales bacterium]|nr:serine hydrolase domain-containing protein [Solirubrobacterales bacterium]
MVADGWEAVAERFRSNFAEFDEAGAACAVYADGVPVVDLWGGVADRRTGAPWSKDTVVNVFSTTKGAAAICVHLLVERGAIDLEAPLARYWPEFGAAGKEDIKVRWVLAHQAGLPELEVPVTIEEACAGTPVLEALERQRPAWAPGQEWDYHGITLGYLLGELVRRVTGKTLGQFFAAEVAEPLGLDAWIGLPEAVAPRVAHLEEPHPPGVQETLDLLLARLDPRGDAYSEVAKAEVRATLWKEGPLRGLGCAFPQLVTEDGGFNDPRVWAAEMPAINMIADARSLARLYASVIGEVDGVRLLRAETVEAMCVEQTAAATLHGYEPGSEAEEIAAAFMGRFSLGLMVESMRMPLPGPRSFGHTGAGGSVAGADPDTGIAVAYVVNRMGSELIDPRATGLMATVSECAANRG